MREYLIEFITRRIDMPRVPSDYLRGYIDALQDARIISDADHKYLGDVIRNR